MDITFLFLFFLRLWQLFVILAVAVATLRYCGYCDSSTFPSRHGNARCRLFLVGHLREGCPQWKRPNEMAFISISISLSLSLSYSLATAGTRPGTPGCLCLEVLWGSMALVTTRLLGRGCRAMVVNSCPCASGCCWC